MTAEVAILNKLAVALAADSALTTGFPGKEKIFSSANKIFALSEHRPVGIMIYGHVEFCSIPWEMLIKEYRSKLGAKSFPKLEDYADDFIKFINNEKVITQKQEEAFVFFACIDAYMTAVNIIRDRGLGENTAGYEVAFAKMQDIADSYPAVPSMEGLKYNEFVKRYSEVFEAFFQIKDFMTCTIPVRKRTKFKELIYADMLNRRTSILLTGVVVAGFGEDEFFPTLKEIKVDGAVFGTARSFDGRACDISRGEETVFISAFAQDDAANAFINGADDQYKDNWQNMLESFLMSFTAEVLEEHTQYDEDGRKVVLKIVKEKIQNTISALGEELDNFASTTYTTPVEEVLRTAPKDELAHVAEALVNLTALRRRVTGERETVGGPIDVAVISKGDGLVWIKRKHYFPAELNPQFMRNRFGGWKNEQAARAPSPESVER